MGISKIFGPFGRSRDHHESDHAGNDANDAEESRAIFSEDQRLPDISDRDEPDHGAELGTLPVKSGSTSTELFDKLAIDWSPSELDRIFAAFDVSQPAENPENLSGREKELGTLLSGILFRRNHAIIAGPRGSGKTSLARVLSHLAEKQGATVVYSSCSAGTTFGQLFRELLEQVPYALVQSEHTNAFEARVGDFNSASNASQAIKALSLLTYSQLILVVDEYDRIDDHPMHSQMASIMKMISDRRLPVRLLLAGSVETLSQIVDEHPSLLRNLTEVVTNPLGLEQIDRMLDACASDCGMAFTQASVELIQEVSCGSPYHARLFGMHAALAARSDDEKTVRVEHVSHGLVHSFEEWAAFNRDDANTFRGIAKGWHGNPTEIFSLARGYASGKVGESPLERHSSLDDNRPEANERALAAFGNSVKKTEGDLVFRDSTAPQFLLSLKYMPNNWGSQTQAVSEQGL